MIQLRCANHPTQQASPNSRILDHLRQRQHRFELRVLRVARRFVVRAERSRGNRWVGSANDGVSVLDGQDECSTGAMESDECQFCSQ